MLTPVGDRSCSIRTSPVCSVVVRREIKSIIDVGTDSSVDNERAAVTEVGELGVELETNDGSKDSVNAWNAGGRPATMMG